MEFKSRRFTIILVSSIITAYLFPTIVLWEADPSQWSQFSRGISVTIISFAIFIGILASVEQQNIKVD